MVYNQDITVWMPEFVKSVEKSHNSLFWETQKLNSLAALLENLNKAEDLVESGISTVKKAFGTFSGIVVKIVAPKQSIAYQKGYIKGT